MIDNANACSLPRVEISESLPDPTDKTDKRGVSSVLSVPSGRDMDFSRGRVANDFSACDTALELLKRDLWPVVVKPGSKAPVGEEWGLHRPDEESIKAIFNRSPGAGVGLLLGPEGGIIDIECDGAKGEGSVRKLFGGEPPATLGWSSARGPHRIFRYDAQLERYGKSIIKLPGLPDLEIRIGGNGKQLQSNCPPTVGADGKSREWNGHWIVAGLPEAVFSFLDTALASPKREVGPHPSRGAAPDMTLAVSSACSAYATAALDDECQAVALAPDGEQNGTLNKAAFALGQLVGAGALDRTVAERRLLEAAADYVQKDGEAQARATIRSGLDAGQNEPRDLSHLDANRHGRPDPVNGQSAAGPRPVVNGKAQGAKRRARRHVTLGRPWSEKGIGELPDHGEPSESDDCCEEPGSNGKPQNSMGKSRSQSQVQVLLNLASDITLFHSADMRPYAKVFVPKQEETTVAEHHQVLGVNSKSFKSWLRMAYFRKTGSAPSAEALTTAIQTLEAKACYEGREVPVHIRVGNAGDCHYLDLCDAAWQVVEISASGWTVLEESPIAFRRTSGMLSLPTPVPGGSLSQLRRYVNTASDDDFKLLVVWLLASLRSTGPYPVLMIQGEQGSAKSTASRVLRSLIDPHSTPLRSEPASAGDLMVTANATWLIALDNLSGVWPWLSDALCRLATGGGFAKRTLYSDEDETHFNAMRPILLNGIDDVADRPDLLDRAILLRLPTIPEDQRQEESKFWSKFEAERPQILGALLDALAEALKVLPDVHLERLPRMADFARFGEAVGRSQGWGAGALLEAYRNNIAGVTVSAAEASPVATAIFNLMNEQEEWQGTLGELLTALTAQLNEREAKALGWPKTSRKLSSELIRLAPVLRRLGISYTRPESRTNKGRKVTLSKIPPPSVGDEPSQPSQPSPSLKNTGFSSDFSSDGPRDDVPTVTATVTGSSPHSHGDNSLNHNWLRHSSDGRDGRDGCAGGLWGWVTNAPIPETDVADPYAVEERLAIQAEEAEYF